MIKGKVMRSTGSWYEVLSEGEHFYQCRLKGKFKIKDLKTSNPIAVGDRVVFTLEEDGFGTISEIEPRQNYIIRKSVHKTAQAHILAANLDQSIIIVTLNMPRTSLGFLDRFLVTAESFRIPTTIVFNKIDLLSEEEKDQIVDLAALYEPLGYSVLFTSVVTGLGMNDLRQKIAGKTTLISGHSGVGKSSLINLLAPDLDLATSEVSTFANKGVHTTTFATMFGLNPETYIIDTPGIKELGLIDMEKEEISHYFPEMRERFGECRYHNCLHINEPKCAVIEAVMTGEIAESRYRSYLSMVEGDDNRR